MNRKSLTAAAAAMLLAASGARADSFTMNLAGPGFHTVSTDCSAGMDSCMPAIPWFGTLTVETTSGAGGTYTGSDVTLIELKTDLYSFSIVPSTDENCCDYAFVTLAGNTPVDLEIRYAPTPFELFTVTGMNATLEIDFNGRGGVYPWAGGAATVFEVPEPSTAALWLAGLVLVGLRFRGASAYPGRSPGPASV